MSWQVTWYARSQMNLKIRWNGILVLGGISHGRYENIFIRQDIDVGPGILIHGKYLYDEEYGIMGTAW